MEDCESCRASFQAAISPAVGSRPCGGAILMAKLIGINLRRWHSLRYLRRMLSLTWAQAQRRRAL